MDIGINFSELSRLEPGAEFSADFVMQDVSIDTRSMKEGDTYLAVKGEKYDGHNFIAQAISSGASSLVVSGKIDESLPCIRVRDTSVSLGNIAKIYRNKLSASVVGITGSNGKTTVKEMVADICREAGDVTATVSNNNNKIGVPLTILSASRDDRYLVIEMGTSEQGEIAYLSDIVEPDVSLITTISESHLEGIGSREDIFNEKSALIRATRPDGVIIINADDDYAGRLQSLANVETVVTYGLDASADVSGSYRKAAGGSMVTLQAASATISYHLHVHGRHNVSNSLAAAAICMSLGIDDRAIICGLEKFRGANGRLQEKHMADGLCLLDDTYNANPSSTLAALNVLAEFQGRKVFVFGGMAELGSRETELHETIGRAATESGVDALFVFGDTAKPSYEAFPGEKYFFNSVDGLNAELDRYLVSDDTVLIKGSRRFQMDRVSQFLEARHV